MAEPHPSGNTKLPQEILFFKILPRLPVEAVPNLMCVCKKWYLFLKSGAFVNRYHHYHQNHHKHLVLSTTNPSRFKSIDCETPTDGLRADRSLPFILPYNGNMSILTSLHGLLCVGITKEGNSVEYSVLILWNPLTGDYKRLSKKGCHDKECYQTFHRIFGLYYISSDDDNMLLRVTHHPNIYIYSLKSDSWRKVESTADFQQMASNWNYRDQPNHILFNEKLYFIKQIDIDTGLGTFIQSYSVMRFDTMTEKFTEIAMPSFGNQVTNCVGFMVLRGYIHFCVAILIGKENNNRCCYEMIELWRMDEDGDWTKVLTYGPMSFFLWTRWSLLHWMRKEIFLIRNEGNVFVLDMKNHTNEMVYRYQSKDSKIPATGNTSRLPYHSIDTTDMYEVNNSIILFKLDRFLF